MASTAVRARQKAEAVERVGKAANKLAKAYKIDPPELPTFHRDTEYLPTLQLEAVADFLDRIAAKEFGKQGAEAKKDATTTPAPEENP